MSDTLEEVEALALQMRVHQVDLNVKRTAIAEARARLESAQGFFERARAELELAASAYATVMSEYEHAADMVASTTNKFTELYSAIPVNAVAQRTFVNTPSGNSDHSEMDPAVSPFVPAEVRRHLSEMNHLGSSDSLLAGAGGAEPFDARPSPAQAMEQACAIIDAFSKEKLSDASLNGLGLAEVPRPLFDARSWLRRLDLSDNVLTRLPDWFSELSELSDVRLHTNPLMHVPPQLAAMPQLASVCITRTLPINEVTGESLLVPSKIEAMFSRAFGPLRLLQRLYAGSNGLPRVPSVVYDRLLNLRLLSLYDNRLTELPSGLSRLEQLETLRVYGNRLTRFPECVLALPRLRELRIDNNLLKSVPFAVSKMPALEVLNVAHNDIGMLPRALGNMQSLQTLVLLGNCALPRALQDPHAPTSELKEHILRLYRGRGRKRKEDPDIARMRALMSQAGGGGGGMAYAPPPQSGSKKQRLTQSFGGSRSDDYLSGRSLDRAIDGIIDLDADAMSYDDDDDDDDSGRPGGSDDDYGAVKKKRTAKRRVKRSTTPAAHRNVETRHSGSSVVRESPFEEEVARWGGSAAAVLQCTSRAHAEALGHQVLFDFLREQDYLPRAVAVDGSNIEQFSVAVLAERAMALGVRMRRLAELVAEGRAYFEPESVQRVALSGRTSLSLQSKMLQVVPPSVFELKMLRRLNLAYNQLVCVPMTLAQLHNLSSLDLSQNTHLVDVPRVIGELPTLETLTLTDVFSTAERVAAFAASPPDWSPLSKLQRLTALRIGGNRLGAVPAEVWSLRTLTELCCDHMELAEFGTDEQVGALTQLKRLTLTNNHLERLPTVLAKLPALDTLLIDENPLAALVRKPLTCEKVLALVMNDCKPSAAPADEKTPARGRTGRPRKRSGSSTGTTSSTTTPAAAASKANGATPKSSGGRGRSRSKGPPVRKVVQTNGAFDDALQQRLQQEMVVAGADGAVPVERQLLLDLLFKSMSEVDKAAPGGGWFDGVRVCKYHLHMTKLTSLPVPAPSDTLTQLVLVHCTWTSEALAQFGKCCEQWPNLSVLTISKCHDMPELPLSLSKLDGLRQLRITSCDRAIGKWLQGEAASKLHLAGLQTLTLSCLGLREIPSFVLRSPLRTLDLNNNRLQRVSSNIASLSGTLRNLFLQQNSELTQLPFSLSELSNLGRLRLDGCARLPGQLDNATRTRDVFQKLRVWSANAEVGDGEYSPLATEIEPDSEAAALIAAASEADDDANDERKEGEVGDDDEGEEEGEEDEEEDEEGEDEENEEKHD